jgi:hypothetical protein
LLKQGLKDGWASRENSPSLPKTVAKITVKSVWFWADFFMSAPGYWGEYSIGFAVYIRPIFFVASLNRYAGKGK